MSKTKQINGNKLTINGNWITYKSYDGYTHKVESIDFEEILEFMFNSADNKTAGNTLVKGFRKFLHENGIYKATNIKELITDIDDRATAIKKVTEGIYSFKNSDGVTEFYSRVLDSVFGSIEYINSELERVQKRMHEPTIKDINSLLQNRF